MAAPKPEKKLHHQASVGFESDDWNTMTKICQQRGGSIADFIRLATLQRIAEMSFFTPERKKALGITVNVEAHEKKNDHDKH